MVVKDFLDVFPEELPGLLPDESHVLHPQAIEVDSQISYVEEPIAVVDRQVRKLRSKEIPSERSFGTIMGKMKLHGNLRKT